LHFSVFTTIFIAPSRPWVALSVTYGGARKPLLVHTPRLQRHDAKQGGSFIPDIFEIF